jgi:hypothetical protein
MACGECPVFAGFVWSADSVVQEKNPISVDAICYLVSCAIHLNDFSCDHEPSFCIPSDSWKRELLPLPPADVVTARWSDVFKYLRKFREQEVEKRQIIEEEMKRQIREEEIKRRISEEEIKMQIREEEECNAAVVCCVSCRWPCSRSLIHLQVGCHLFDPRAVFKRWDSVFIAVGHRTIGVSSSRDKAVARALRPLVAADEAHKAISLAGCGVKAVTEHAGRKHVMAVSAHRDSSGSAPEFIFAFHDSAARDAVILRVQVQTPSSRLLFATF